MVRRRWLNGLHVPKKIRSPLLVEAKKVEEDAWIMFQHQLVTVGIVTVWEHANVSELFGNLRRVWYVPARLYIKIIPLLNIENVHSLLVWRAWGYNVNNRPTDILLSFLRRGVEKKDDEEKVGEGQQVVAGERTYEMNDLQDEEEESEFDKVAKNVCEHLEKTARKRVADACQGKFGTETKRRKISVQMGRIKDIRCTMLQLEVIKNTRDKFITGPAGEISIQQRLYPNILIHELPLDDANNAVRISLYQELLSANMDPGKIANICISHYPNFDLTIEASMPKFVVDLDFFLREKVEATRSKTSMQQRQSITVLSEIQDNANRERATVLIQRWWKRWLYVRKPERRKAGAVIARFVEHWWRYKNGIQKRVIRKSFTFRVEDIEQSSPDYMDYDNYVEVQKKDYSRANLKNPPQRGWKFWASAGSLFAVLAGVGVAAAPLDVDTVTKWMVFSVLHVMTYARLITWVRVTQTVLLTIITSYILRELVGNPFLPLLPVVAMFSVATLRHMWPFLAIPCVIGYFAYGAVATPTDAAFWAIHIVYPIYSVITVVAASREGDPITLLHKLQTNYLVLIFMGLFSAMSIMYVGFCVATVSEGADIV